MNAEHIGLGLIAPEHLPWVWPRVRDWLAAALEHYEGKAMSSRAMRERIRRRRYGLLVGTRGERIVGAVVLEFGEQRGRRVLNLVAAGGERGRALELVGPTLWEGVRAVGRALGADCVRVEGRRGWLRWLGAERARVRQVVADFPVGA